MGDRLGLPLIGFSAALLLAASGCGREASEKTYRVEGLLTVNGEPAGNASVAFHPVGGEANASCSVGMTDAEGRFRLTTRSPQDGAPAGEYRVTIVWLEHLADFDECDCPDPLQHDRLKGLYADPQRSTVRATVRAAEIPEANRIRIDAWRERRVEDLRAAGR